MPTPQTTFTSGEIPLGYTSLVRVTSSTIPPQDRVIRMPELLLILGISRATAYDRMAPKSPRHDPEFPRPIRLGLRARGWMLSEIQLYLESRKNDRNQLK